MHVTSSNIPEKGQLKLTDGSRVAVIGGGPAGSFFTYFLLDLCERLDIKIHLDVFEAYSFTKPGPAGCNHCGGIVSESLVQMLSTEGITIPKKIIQRGIDSYVMHTEMGVTKIETPLHEKRIAAMFRGGGPLGSEGVEWASFDRFLQEMTQDKGANLILERVKNIRKDEERYNVQTIKGTEGIYDLVAGAVGLNPHSLKLFENLKLDFRPPETTKTFICEFHLGAEEIHRLFGTSMHVFLLDIPRIKFAALIPKGDYVTFVMLGKDIDKKLVQTILESSAVKNCFPPDWDITKLYPCQCFPKINMAGAIQPFSDGLVLMGDCAVSKLYKNGIGAAYFAGKAAATTAVLHGISKSDFQKHYWPTCKKLNFDNFLGKMVFAVTTVIQKSNFLKKGVHRMVQNEQLIDGNKRFMSMVLWDTFTGSAPYKDILLRTIKPGFWGNFIYNIGAAMFGMGKKSTAEKTYKDTKELGKLYRKGDAIVTQGEVGDCLFVIQSGSVEVLHIQGKKEVYLATLNKGDFFGEMALFEKEVRSSTVRALDDVRALTVDKRMLLTRIQDDPSMAFRILQKMSSRIRVLDKKISRIKGSDRRNWDKRKDEPVK
jgi:flavin-dependent dehydrogenase